VPHFDRAAEKANPPYGQDGLLFAPYLMASRYSWIGAIGQTVLRALRAAFDDVVSMLKSAEDLFIEREVCLFLRGQRC